MTHTDQPHKRQPGLWIQLYDEEPASHLENTSISHEKIINAIHEDSLDQFNCKFATITCDKFAHPQILYHLTLKILSFSEESLLSDDDRFRKFLTNIFVTAVDISTLEILEEFLKLRLSFAPTGIKHKDGCKMYKSERFILLLNQLTTDERSEVYQNFVLHLMRWAALSPVQVVTCLINTVLTRPSLIPPVCQILTKQLRPIVTSKFCHSSCPLITSLLNFSLFHPFTRKEGCEDKVSLHRSEHSSCFVQFIREFYKARYLKNQSSIISIESIVIEWITLGYISPATVSLQIDILNQLIESNLGGRLLWSNINLVKLLLYFVTCLITLRRRANVKEVFLSTIDCIMKRHIQRMIEINEIDQLFHLVKPEDTLLLIYFDQYSHDSQISTRVHVRHPRLSKYQLIMMSCMQGKITPAKQSAPFPRNSQELIKPMQCMLTFMTKSEIANVLRAFLHCYSTADSVDILFTSLAQLFKGHAKSPDVAMDFTYLISSIDVAIGSTIIGKSIVMNENHSGAEVSNVNGKPVMEEKKPDALDTHYLSQGNRCAREDGDTEDEDKDLHENEHKVIISQGTKKLLDVVPVDCRAIVLQLGEDLSGY